MDSSERAALADLPLAATLELIAAETPSPGGGSAAALAAAIAASLTRMVAAFALARTPRGDERIAVIAARAADLHELLLALAEEDRSSYQPVLTALARGRDDEQREQAVAAALSAAAEIPHQIASYGAELAALAAELLGAPGNDALCGDASTAVILAEGACRSAARLVELNLAGAPEDPRVESARAFARAAADVRERALPSA